MDIKQFPKQLEAQLPDGVARLAEEISWSRTAAAGSLLVSAYLMIAGKRKGALAAAVAAGTMIAFENPQATREIWEKVPDYLRQSHEFLGRLEEVIAEVSEQGGAAPGLRTRVARHNLARATTNLPEIAENKGLTRTLIA